MFCEMRLFSDGLVRAVYMTRSGRTYVIIDGRRRFVRGSSL